MTLNRELLSFISIIGFVAMLMPLPIDMYLPAFPEISYQLSANANEVQMTFSTYLLGFAIGYLFYGPISDFIGRRPILLLGLLGLSVLSLCCAFSQSIDQLIIARFIQGTFSASVSVVIIASVRDRFSQEEFSRMMSLLMSIAIISPLFAPFLGAALLNAWGWESIFYCISILSFIALLLSLFFINETLAVKDIAQGRFLATQKTNLGLINNKNIICNMLAMAFSYAGLFSFLGVVSFIYIDVFHVPPDKFGFYLIPNIILLLIMALFNIFFVKSLGYRAMFFISLFIQFIMGGWLLLVGIFELGLIPLMLGVAIFIGCVAMVSSNGMAIILHDNPQMAATLSSLYGVLQFGIGALIGLIQATYYMPGVFSMAVSLAICATTALMFYLYANIYPFRGERAPR